MSETQFDLTGRTAIVTGAARGIGRAIAAQLARAGAAVLAVDLDQDLLAATALEIDVIPIVADVSRTEDVEGVVARALAETGQVDILVNNAGILRDGMLWKLTDEDWDSVLAVHLGGTFRVTRACVPHLRERAYGRIVNVTSYTGLHGNIGQAAYAAAKAGIIGFTKTAAKELARFGVTANTISPNADTRMIESIPAARRAELETQIPMGRFADPGEIAAAVAFLASEEAGYITGTVLPVDGGLAM